ncbi:MAG TPA: reverse transcriptase domain-containing protein [Symbiobacteriaceae bacterium]
MGRRCRPESYFDTIPHDRLIDQVAEEISDSSILRLIRAFLESGVMEGGTFTHSERGTPQGGVISPLLANIYLHAFNVRMTERGHALIRFADDWVILCRSQSAAERVMEGAKRILEQELGLTMHPEKSRVVSAMEGFNFLGYTFWARPNNREDGPRWYHGRRPSDKSLERCQDRLRELTRRNQTVSPEELAYRIRSYVRGWMAYFHKGKAKTRFGDMDMWLRRRFRMVVIRSWRSARKVHSILIRRGWKREKLIGFSPYRWRNSKCPMVHAALDTQWLKSVGFVGLLDCYLKLSPARG